MSVNPSPIGGYAAQFFDNNGVILSGGKIYTYAAGTTTPQATYTSAAGVTPHSNPIVLDSAGRVPGGEIWLTDGLVYKFVIETSNGILIGSYDNITGVNSNFVNYTVQEEVITATAGQTVFNLSTINYTPGTNSLSVYIDGVNQYVGDSYLETDSNTVTFTSGVHVGGEVKFTTAIQTTTGAVNADIVAYDPPFTGGVATNVEAKLSEYVSVKDFGAVGDGVADDTAAIQAAIDYGQTSGQAVYIPASDYLVSSSIVISAPVTFFGDGWESRLRVASAFSASADVISIDPAAYTENIIIRDMSIQPVSGTPARYGIGVDITTYGVAYCEFSGLRIAELGDYCFATIPASPSLIDGFFTSVIDRNTFIGGVKLDSCGDSIRVTNNTITGPRTGVYVDMQRGPFDGGAHGLLIDGNNITSDDGALYVLNCTMGVFSNNNVEMPTPGSPINNAMINLDGVDATYTVNGMALINNFLGSAVAGYDTIRVNWGRNVLIFGNYVSYPSGAKAYKITANATGTRILQNDDALDVTYAASVDDSGTGTMYERAFGGDWQQSLNLRFVEPSRSVKWQDSAGTALGCLQLSDADDYFYVGPDAATTLTGGVTIRVNGSNVAQFSPAGNLALSTPGKGLTVVSPNGSVSRTITIDNAGNLVLI